MNNRKRIRINDQLVLRPLEERDPLIFHKAFSDQGWNKPVSQYEDYFKLQSQGHRDIIVADWEGSFAGYLTIKWNSDYPAFAKDGIPEIVDFNVLKKYQRRHIGSALMDEAEKRIKKVSAYAGIGVGVTEDYGAAHILYVKRGYFPDGTGMKKNHQSLKYGDQVVIDDDLAIYMMKQV
ncbi:MAG: GNAT family N-acetyltransferase [Saprospiraceae bacterium]|nr:GNAT family N-acetyltransferase [Saprospiraceae bacterium]